MKRGFTIIEMLVIIVVIAILMGLLIPAISGGIRRAKKTTELNAIRQVGLAWQLYSGSNREHLMPGFLRPEVQGIWEVAYAYPDGSIVDPAPTYEEGLPNMAGPWPWRLLDRMNYDWRTLLGYDDIEWSDTTVVEHAAEIALSPGFAYNGYYLGGWWEAEGAGRIPKPEFNSVQLADGRTANVVATTAAQVRSPAGVLAFISCFRAEPGVHGHLPDYTPGADLAIPRLLADVEQWNLLTGGNIDAFEFTSPPIGRYNGLPAVSFADGHVDDLPISDLTDQRLWIPSAQEVAGIPARDFSHSEQGH